MGVDSPASGKDAVNGENRASIYKDAVGPG